MISQPLPCKLIKKLFKPTGPLHRHATRVAAFHIFSLPRHTIALLQVEHVTLLAVKVLGELHPVVQQTHAVPLDVPTRGTVLLAEDVLAGALQVSTVPAIPLVPELLKVGS